MASAPARKNKQLSEYNRNSLFQHAKRLVTESEDRAVLNEAYEAAAAVVIAVVQEKYPPRDMKVLARYDAARNDRCVNLSTGNGDYDQFCFRDDDDAPLRPNAGGCRRYTYLLSEQDAAVTGRFAAAQKAYDAALETRLSDYKALIFSVRSFNEVAAIWPEAEQLREAIVGSATALSVLNTDVVERIQRDAAQRVLEAA